MESKFRHVERCGRNGEGDTEFFTFGILLITETSQFKQGWKTARYMTIVKGNALL